MLLSNLLFFWLALFSPGYEDHENGDDDDGFDEDDDKTELFCTVDNYDDCNHDDMIMIVILLP